MVVEQLREFGGRRHQQLGQLPASRNGPRIGVSHRYRQRQRAQHAWSDFDRDGESRLNIHNMLNKSRGEMAYTMVDVDSPVAQSVIDAIGAINGVLWCGHPASKRLLRLRDPKCRRGNQADVAEIFPSWVVDKVISCSD